MLSLFPRDVLDEIWDLIESVYEGFPTNDQCSHLLIKISINVRNRHDRTKGEGWSTANSLTLPSNFIAGRLNAALLFWFFGGFRCGV